MMQYNAVYAFNGTPNSFKAYAPGLTIRNCDHLGRTAYLSLSPTGSTTGFPILAGETVTIPMDSTTTVYAWNDGPADVSGPDGWVYLRYFTAGGIA